MKMDALASGSDWKIPAVVVHNKDILFGNIVDIHTFQRAFLAQLEAVKHSVPDICRLFLKCVSFSAITIFFTRQQQQQNNFVTAIVNRKATLTCTPRTA